MLHFLFEKKNTIHRTMKGSIILHRFAILLSPEKKMAFSMQQLAGNYTCAYNFLLKDTIHNTVF